MDQGESIRQHNLVPELMKCKQLRVMLRTVAITQLHSPLRQLIEAFSITLIPGTIWRRTTMDVMEPICFLTIKEKVIVVNLETRSESATG